MKIMVTGGRGFLGNKISLKLQELGFEVETLSRTNSSDQKHGLKHHQLDLSQKIKNITIFEGVDCVFHTAAKAGIGGKYNNYYTANFLGTQNLLHASKTSGVRFFVYTSSPSVVFSGKAIQDGKENMPYVSSRLSPYSYTKAIAEKEVLSFNDHSFKTIALRPHLIWGDNDPHLLPRIICRHKSGKLKIIGDGSNQMDLTHIDNVVHAHILAFNALITGNQIGGRAYFISQNEPVHLWSWLNSIFTKLDLHPVNKKISLKKAYSIGLVAELLWKIFPLKADLPMTRFVACQLAHDHWFSTAAAKRDFGYEPILSMKDALDKTTPWLRNL